MKFSGKMRTGKIRLAVLAWLLIMVISIVPLAGCAGNAADEPVQLTLATGGTAGTYYPLGSAIASAITDYAAGVEVTAVTAAGSVSNAEAIRDGQAEMILIGNNIAFYAHQGTQMFDGQPVEAMRGIATLYPEIIQIVALKESGIADLNDLKGKKAGVGAPGSGTAVHTLEVFKAAGLDETNVDIQYLDFKECVDGLLAGTIDAACIVAGIPTAAVTEIAAERDVTILTIPGGIYRQLSDKYPFYVPITIPAGTYAGVDQDVTSIAVRAMLATSADLSEDTVYAATKAVFEHTDVLVAAHQRGKDVTLQSALDGMSIPLHPGAKRYFLEMGLTLP
jgi:uncharacterized protein